MPRQSCSRRWKPTSILSTVAKYAAGREKDRAFGRAAFQRGLARATVVVERLDLTPLAAEQRQLIAALIRVDA
jgi:hypothetical protein